MTFLCLDEFDADEIAIVVRKIMKRKIVVAIAVIIEAIKFETCVKNIKFFDFTMLLNLLEFRISINNASFQHHLIEFFVMYKENNILKFFFQCFRDSALIWFKNQSQFTSLNDFKTIVTKIFSFSTFAEFVANFDRAINDFSSQRYHQCFECFIQFSSTSRFLIHAQKNCFKIFTCKHCEKVFTLNNKLHEHARLLYNKTLK